MNFKVLDEYGKEVQCELLYTFSDEHNDINYIIYTDGELNEEGLQEVYASRFELVDNTYILKGIENDSEWDLVDAFLATKIKK